MIADGLAFYRGIHDRVLLQGDDGGAHEERHEGQSGAMALLKAVFQFVTKVDDAGHIYFEHAMNVSAGAAGLDHALRDDLAHLGHGDEIAGYGCGRWWSRARRW